MKDKGSKDKKTKATKKDRQQEKKSFFSLGEKKK